LNAAEKLIPICRKYSVPFILNDSALLALECGADGVHIGDEDCSVAEAREIIGNKTLGVSCYNSTDRALESAQAGADIISFGAFFPTTTKTPKSKAEIGTVNRLRAAQPSAKISAIGGITPQNCAPLIAAGVDYLCVISYIWNHPISPEKAIAEFSEILSAG
ncbi:MAG: thiamine phosphate synthase, partial [Alphaproteobacteria bacterium CG11_big_fil_rev_8_21_14_0_20_44_7]